MEESTGKMGLYRVQERHTESDELSSCRSILIKCLLRVALQLSSLCLVSILVPLVGWACLTEVSRDRLTRGCQEVSLCLGVLSGNLRAHESRQ